MKIIIECELDSPLIDMLDIGNYVRSKLNKIDALQVLNVYTEYENEDSLIAKNDVGKVGDNDVMIFEHKLN